MSIRRKDVPPDCYARLAAAGLPAKAKRLAACVVAPAVALEVTVPYRAVNESNQRSWQGRARRTKLAREMWGLVHLVTNFGALRFPRPILVTMTRLGPRSMDDDGNVSSLKGLRDAIAASLGLDDGDSRLSFAYRQEVGGDYGVRVRIEARGGAEHVRER